MALSVASQSVLQKQRILASFYEVLVPKLQALGQVGTLAQQRLAMLMADAGVMEGRRRRRRRRTSSTWWSARPSPRSSGT